MLRSSSADKIVCKGRNFKMRLNRPFLPRLAAGLLLASVIGSRAGCRAGDLPRRDPGAKRRAREPGVNDKPASSQVYEFSFHLGPVHRRQWRGPGRAVLISTHQQPLAQTEGHLLGR
jgi:hypothetical protein